LVGKGRERADDAFLAKGGKGEKKESEAALQEGEEEGLQANLEKKKDPADSQGKGKGT